jgi:hypothetical protein
MKPFEDPKKGSREEGNNLEKAKSEEAQEDASETPSRIPARWPIVNFRAEGPVA